MLNLNGIRLAIVVAVAENGVIGRLGELPWRIPSDLKRFREITLGKPVIMGRKTFQSIKKKLDKRSNIVITRDACLKVQDAKVVTTIDEAVASAFAIAGRDSVEEVMVIGGSQIYSSLIESADRIYLTRVHGRPEGDTYFPKLVNELWSQTAYEKLSCSEWDEYDATSYILDRCTHRDQSKRVA
ncbi:MAG TPA: hypothetical protein TECP_00287 [Hyphomicrobiaceae bacterium MAG_BT-2024]